MTPGKGQDKAISEAGNTDTSSFGPRCGDSPLPRVKPRPARRNELTYRYSFNKESIIVRNQKGMVLSQAPGLYLALCSALEVLGKCH